MLTKAAQESFTGVEAIIDTARATGLALTDSETARLIAAAGAVNYRNTANRPRSPHG